MKIMKFDWRIFVLSFAVLFISVGCNRDIRLVRGNGFSIRFPPGWVRIDREIEPAFKMESKFSPQQVTFATPKINSDTNVPDAMITVFMVHPDQPFWLEDDFPTLLDVLARSGYLIMDHGQVKIDDQIANWVIYRDDYQERIRLEFFSVNDSGIVFRLQYSVAQARFSAYRQDFEDAKSTISLRKW